MIDDETFERSLPNRLWLQPAALVVGLISIQAATFDALENGVSFIMLADPQGFADWLIYPYSSLAVAKFLCHAITYIWALLALLIITISRIIHYLKPSVGLFEVHR